MSKEHSDKDDAEKSNEYYKVKGNPLDGYWRDLDYSPMEYSPFMARLGLLIAYVVAAVVVTNLIWMIG